MHNGVVPRGSGRYDKDPISDIHVTSADEIDNYVKGGGKHADELIDWRKKAKPYMEGARDIGLDLILQRLGAGAAGVVFAIIAVQKAVVDLFGEAFNPTVDDINDKQLKYQMYIADEV